VIDVMFLVLAREKIPVTTVVMVENARKEPLRKLRCTSDLSGFERGHKFNVDVELDSANFGRKIEDENDRDNIQGPHYAPFFD